MEVVLQRCDVPLREPGRAVDVAQALLLDMSDRACELLLMLYETRDAAPYCVL